MKIGIALSGGGIRGIAHAGVLKALEENGIKIDIIGGTSAGSMVASLYAIGYNPDEIYECFVENSKIIVGENRFPVLYGIRSFMNKNLAYKGFKKGENIENVFSKLANEKNIDKISSIKMPIVIPTVDIKDAREYIFTNNIPNNSLDQAYLSISNNNNIYRENVYEKYITDVSVGEAVRASSSFPAVFNLCTIQTHAFIDGGALDNIPVEEVRKQGADKVIAVKFEEDKVDETSNMMEIVMKTIDIMGCKIIERNLQNSDYVVNIKTEKMGLLDTRNINKCFECGYKAINNNIEAIKNVLHIN